MDKEAVDNLITDCKLELLAEVERTEREHLKFLRRMQLLAYFLIGVMIGNMTLAAFNADYFNLFLAVIPAALWTGIMKKNKRSFAEVHKRLDWIERERERIKNLTHSV